MLVSVTGLGMRPAEHRVEEAKVKLREAQVVTERVRLVLEVIGLQERKGRSVWVMAFFGKGARLALSAVVHKYGDVCSEGSEFRSPSFDPSRRRDTPAPPQDELDSVLKADR